MARRHGGTPVAAPEGAGRPVSGRRQPELMGVLSHRTDQLDTVDMAERADKHKLLLALGWRVLEFTASDIPGRPALVADQVRRARELARAG